MPDKISHKELLPLAIQLFARTDAVLEQKPQNVTANAYAKQFAKNFTDFYHELCQGLSNSGAMDTKLENQ